MGDAATKEEKRVIPPMERMVLDALEDGTMTITVGPVDLILSTTV
jgi:hypothetical protein